MFTPHRLALDDLRERGAPVDSRLLRLAMQGPTTRDSEGRGSSATRVLRLKFAMHQLPATVDSSRARPPAVLEAGDER